MVTNVEARNPRGRLLSLALRDPSSGYTVRDIEGLDPVKAIIVESTFAMLEGSQYQTSRREARDIVLKLGMDPSLKTGGGSVRALRAYLYEMFMPKSEVNLRFTTEDGLVVHITGRVESFSAPLFVQEPEATISVRCFLSDFEALTAETWSGATADQSGNWNLLRFNYSGSIEAGVTYRLNVNRSIAGFDIHHVGDDNIVRSMELDVDLAAGDILELVTVPGQKRVHRIRGGARTPVAYAVSPSSAWTLLSPGTNAIQILTPGGAIPYTVSTIKRYGGL